MNSMEPQNCWEYWNCKKDVRNPCPAYVTGSGKKCFFIADDYCLKGKEDLNDCHECPWFRKTFWTGTYI